MEHSAGPAPRWQIEQVLALAPRPNSVAAAQAVAVPSRWVATGCDDQALWGRCIGAASEPYDVAVHLGAVAFRCSCPSRVAPCKHVLALLMLWVQGQVAAGARPGALDTWIAAQAAAPPGAAQPPPRGPVATDPAPARGDAAPATRPAAADVPPEPPSATRDRRIARMAEGLAELDRWLEDRMRTGLADPSLARYSTWDDLAARLVDAQVGSLANRVRRLAGAVGSAAQWHEQMLADLGLLHLLAQAGRRIPALDDALADSVAAAVGWQVRQADVLAGVPRTDRWMVMGRSDTREDRIEVRRVWLRGERTRAWAMVLSFAAYQQRLDDSLAVGSAFEADVFAYPGALGLRGLVGRRGDTADVAEPPPASSVRGACDEIGRAVVAEPWIERYPVCVRATVATDGSRWVLTDDDGSLPLADSAAVAALLACTGGDARAVTAEWTPAGLVPLTVHLDDRHIDIGPVADASFVGAS